MNVNVMIAAKRGYAHSQVLIEPARYLTYALRKAGYRASTTVNRFEPECFNIIFGSHIYFDQLWGSQGNFAIFNLEQLERGQFDSHQIDQRYLQLLKDAPVIDYDNDNVKLYRGGVSRCSRPNVPIFQFGYAPYLDIAQEVDLESRPIDLLFFGSMNKKRQEALRRIQGCGVSVRCVTFNSPIYGEELNRLIRSAKAVINIPFFEHQIFEQVRVAQVLSCGTPVISPIARHAPDVFRSSVMWYESGAEEVIFSKYFLSPEWFGSAFDSLLAWRENSSYPNFREWAELGMSLSCPTSA